MKALIKKIYKLNRFRVIRASAILSALMLALPPFHPGGASETGAYALFPEGGTLMIYGTGDRYFAVNRAHYLNSEMQNHISRLSSGLRITKAGDDPAGTAVAEKMQSVINEIRRKSLNEEDMRNFHRFTESALSHQNDLLRRIRELITRAGSGIMGPDEREIIQNEINHLLRAIDSNAEFAGFNRKLVIPDLTAEGIGVSELDITRDIMAAFKMIDDAMDRIIRMRSVQGTKENLLTMRIEGQTYYYVNLQAAQSRIKDLNMAEEISNMIKTGTAIRFNYGVILLRD